MPMDFAAIAAQFAGSFATQLRSARFAQRLLEPVLNRRRAAARSAAEATRMFPVVRFYDGAVTLRLAPGQRGALTPVPPPPSFGAQLGTAVTSLFEGLLGAIAPLRAESQEKAIPRFIVAIEQTLMRIEDSIARFSTPDKGMFDPDPRKASDLIGLVVLGFRALAEASRAGGEVERLAARVRDARTAFGMDVSAASATTSRAAPLPGVAERSLPEKLEAAAFSLLGAVVVIGSLPSLVTVLLDGIRLRIRQLLLGLLGATEQVVYGVRHTAYQLVFGTLTGIARRATELVAAGHTLISGHVLFLLRFWQAFGSELAFVVRNFVVRIGELLQAVTELVRLVPTLLEAATRVDIVELLRSKIGWIAGPIPEFTLSDLVDRDGRNVNMNLAMALDLALIAGQKALGAPKGGLLGKLLKKKIESSERYLRLARWLVRELFRGGGLTGTEIVVPRETAALGFRSDFPDLGDTVFGAGMRKDVQRVLGKVESGLRTGVTGALTRTAEGLTVLATGFAAEAGRAAKIGAGARLTDVARQSDTLADSVFGPEMRRERQALARRPANPLAHAYESWLAAGGFLAVERVLDAYTGELAAHWWARLTEGTELTAPVAPSSPRILLRHATVGRVQVPRLTLRAAPGRELDATLADAVAGEFATAVRDAYRTGAAQLRQFAADAGP